MSAIRVSPLLAVAAGLLFRAPALSAQAYPPANVTVAQGPAGVTVTWSMVKGRGVTYRVLRSLDPAKPGQDLTKPVGYTPDGFVDQSAAPNTTYFYQVVAVYGPGTEGASVPVQFSPPQLQMTALGARGKTFAPPPAPIPAPVPPAAPPTQGMVAVGGGTGRPVAATPSGLTPVAMAPPGAGPPPLYVRAVGTPAEAHVTWLPATGATGYVVSRWSLTDPNCCKAQSAMLPATATSYDDLIQWTGRYAFRVKSIFPPDAANPGGREGHADTDYSYPQPEAPTGFQGTQMLDGSIKFTWTAANKASGYIFAGPPTNTAIRVNGTSVTVPSAPPGPQTWQIWSQYDPPSGAQARAASTKVSLTLNVAATGKYRVTAQSIQVAQPTGDAPNVGQVISTFISKNDGAGDEVYVTAFAQTLKRSDHNEIQTYPIMVSAVHGDVNAYPQDHRVLAGTASGSGGLRAGDVIPQVLGQPAPGAQGYPLFVLWEGRLTDGMEDLVIHPVLWDADQPDQDLSRLVGTCPYLPQCQHGHLLNWAGYLHTLNGAHRPAAAAAYQSPQIAVIPGDVVWIESEPYLRHLELQNTDRPIGLEDDGTGPPTFGVTGQLRDMQVILSREKIEAALTSGNNTIVLRMWDHYAKPGLPQTYNNQSGGDYTLVLRLERVP